MVAEGSCRHRSRSLCRPLVCSSWRAMLYLIEELWLGCRAAAPVLLAGHRRQWHRWMGAGPIVC